MKELKCRKLILNNEKPLICVSITAANLREIKTQAKVIKKLKPDIVEWRADYLKIEDEKKDTFEIAYALKCVHKALKKYPIIFAFRNSDEGGQRRVNFEKYREYCHYAALDAKSNNLEFIDVEAFGKKDIPGINDLIEDIHSLDVKVIGSYHNFKVTPSKDEVINILKTMSNMGADVCKIATTPNGKRDVYSVMNGAKEFDETNDALVVAISMGELGAVSRVALSQSHSVITFASYDENATTVDDFRNEDIMKMNALGQLPFDIVKYLLKFNQCYKLDKNISIVGFMGTGKTTVSKALSSILNCKEVDTDKCIVDREGITIAELFEKVGEEEFRKIESEEIKKVASRKGLIISCGGGAVIRKENAEALKYSGPIVRLDATLETIFSRVRRRTTRPLLNDNMTMEHVKKLMDDRELRYREACDITVNVDGNNRILTCYNILKKLEDKKLL